MAKLEYSKANSIMAQLLVARKFLIFVKRVLVFLEKKLMEFLLFVKRLLEFLILMQTLME